MKKSIKKKIIAALVCFNFLTFAPLSAFAGTNVSIKGNPNAKNNYPIIMVHGLFGWGGNELFGVNYWGGKGSIKKELTAQGYEVYTPTVGSVSSNWDRACELYAEIVGTKVDYGEYHSKTEGHARYGKDYTNNGICPNVGKIVDGHVQKVHLVGHSMGGETIRVLAQLLENGYEDEIKYGNDNNDISPLFKGGQHWIESITTIATPEDGSAEAAAKYAKEPITHDLVATVAAITGVSDFSKNPCFDLKLDQWGLQKKSNESFADYFKRVENSKIWQRTNDLSVYDLSFIGAQKLNSWVKAQPDIYYYSIACCDTHKDLLTGYQMPNINMSPILLKSSINMGKFTDNTLGNIPIDKTWWQNDGVVSIRSAIAPQNGSTDKWQNYTGENTKGIWNYVGLIDNVDHLEVVGMNKQHARLQPYYNELAKRVTNLPQ